MFESFVAPRIRPIAGNVVLRKRVVKISGMGESAIDEIISPIYKSYPEIDVSILFNKSEVEAHLTCKADSGDVADSKNQKLVDEICLALGDAVFSDSGEEMEAVVARMLIERGEDVAVAESCTGGLVTMRLTEVPGSSSYFKEGVVVYANSAKVRYLDVPDEKIIAHGAVSAEVAEAMAAGMLTKSGATHALAVTGIAGPSGGSADKPVGTVFIAYASRYMVRSVKVTLPGDRFLIRWRASQAALDLLRRQMLRSDRSK